LNGIKKKRKGRERSECALHQQGESTFELGEKNRPLLKDGGPFRAKINASSEGKGEKRPTNKSIIP